MTLDLSQFDLDPSVHAIIEEALTRLPYISGAPLMVNPIYTSDEEKERMLETLLTSLAITHQSTLLGGEYVFNQVINFKFLQGLGRVYNKDLDALQVCRTYQANGGTCDNTEGLLYLVCLALLKIDLNV